MTQGIRSAWRLQHVALRPQLVQRIEAPGCADLLPCGVPRGSRVSPTTTSTGERRSVARSMRWCPGVGSPVGVPRVGRLDGLTAPGAAGLAGVDHGGEACSGLSVRSPVAGGTRRAADGLAGEAAAVEARTRQASHRSDGSCHRCGSGPSCRRTTGASWSAMPWYWSRSSPRVSAASLRAESARSERRQRNRRPQQVQAHDNRGR